MTYRTPLALILGLMILVCSAAAASATGAASHVSVTNTTVDPATLMPGDTGTITAKVMNSGTEPVQVSRAVLKGTEIKTLNDGAYEAAGTIGPGTTVSYTFTIRADPNTHDGVYYPWFSLDYGQDGSLSTRVPVRVEETPLTVVVTGRPDAFTEGKKEHITLVVGNPRTSPVTGITVTPRGEGIEAAQTGWFVGTLAPSAQANVTLDVTATQETDLAFDVTYHTGPNTHTATVTLPVVFGQSNTRAELVVNNIEVHGNFGSYSVSGDIANAGLEAAKSVVVTSGDPAVPENPYPEYAIGSLDPDDLASFELDFSAENATSVPLVITYRDADGTPYTRTMPLAITKHQTISTGVHAPAATETKDESIPLPVMILFGVVGLGVLGAILKSSGLLNRWRK
ncbi:hypothetical protein RJ40_04410 [Methanofollis aquaemaris]|uniref:CARDB domain-containing protein n=1 Tax=Methanofollis aquaemaris TaxID=126734 RepID=A0A8A3S3E3_9EURY|nr:hypothetical protein [Methanofollis aquaemaris]QSZ66787.1 hypothetical protein RJ40_04410 [Methanofollis aquaemaris]